MGGKSGVTLTLKIKGLSPTGQEIEPELTALTINVWFPSSAQVNTTAAPG
jgi:hypothetical protein